MIIKDGNKYSVTVSRRTIRRFLLVCFLAGLAIVFWMANGRVKSQGYENLGDFITVITSNYFSSRNTEVEEIAIRIGKDDFKKLHKNRERALERGVIVNDLDGEYVDGVITTDGKETNVRLRLKGHMTDHLQEDKWSFRIKVKGKGDIMGMRRFSVQHPGTRGYLSEWIYHELMRREDIIALRYKFVRISVNGKDWGIYALEENFDNELLDNNQRKPGPIIRFNPDLYWVNRLNEYKRVSSYDEFASYYSANPEAYRESGILKDSIQRSLYLKAIGMIEGLRSRELVPAQVFDVPRLARFHALIDLVGGLHSIDWSDIKYYLNPVTGKLEPVAYESFTELGSREIAGQYRFVVPDSGGNYEDWHQLIFSDPVFFREYIRQLDRVSSASYLDDFFSSSADAIRTNLAILYKEFPYKKFDKKEYYRRQQVIKKILSPPKAIHAFFIGNNSNRIRLEVAAIDALPVEVKGIVIDGVSSEDLNKVLPCKQPSKYVRYTQMEFVMPENWTWRGAMQDSIRIRYGLPGSDQLMETAVFSYPHTETPSASLAPVSTVESFPFLYKDEAARKIFVRPGDHRLDSDLVIPPGYQFFMDGSSSLDLRNKAKIVSYSSLRLLGDDDRNIRIISGDSSSEGILVIGASRSRLEHVSFKGFSYVSPMDWKRKCVLTFYESPVTMTNCVFSDFRSSGALNLIRSDFLLEQCHFFNLNGDALNLDFSDGSINSCVFEKCGHDAVDVLKSSVTIRNMYADSVGGKVLNAKSGSQIAVTKMTVRNSFVAILATDLAVLALSDIEISSCKNGVVANAHAYRGAPMVSVTRLTSSNCAQPFLKSEEAAITIDGKKVEKNSKNIEDLMKDEKNK